MTVSGVSFFCCCCCFFYIKDLHSNIKPTVTRHTYICSYIWEVINNTKDKIKPKKKKKKQYTCSKKQPSREYEQIVPNGDFVAILNTGFHLQLLCLQKLVKNF